MCLQGEDVELEPRSPPAPDASWETKIAFAWAKLMMTVGRVSDALYVGVHKI